MIRSKYPRTPHLPWSPGATSDDTWIDPTCFENKQVVITEKMDGENTTLYSDGFHARSLDSRHHPSRSWVKNLHASIKNDIPKDFKICGENLYAVHSIKYTDLESYFLVFSVWKNNICLSWEETIEWCNLLGLTTVPIIYSGLFSKVFISYLEDKILTQNKEGYVVRLADEFQDFSHSVAKWVRPGHVQTNKHWLNEIIVANGLKN